MFCIKCGNQLMEGSLFCNKCGNKVVAENISQAASTMPLPQTYNVSVFRPSQTYLINPPMNVTVDGITDASIANGEKLVLKLEEGPHRIAFSLSARSKEIEILLESDLLITIKWNRLTGGIAVETSKS